MAERAAEKVISRGAINAVINGGDQGAVNPQPLLQVLLLKPMKKTQPGEAQPYRIVLSDIDEYSQGMLASTAFHLVESETLKTFSIVKITSFTINELRNPDKPLRKVIIVTELEVLSEYWPLSKIGSPTEVGLRSVDEKPQNTTIGSNGTISGNEFYGKQQQQQQQQAPARSQPKSHAPQSSAHSNIYPIESITPYAHKWAIRARCSHKSEIKTWRNKNGEGKLFSVNLLDESGEIRATGFNDQCDKLYDLFQDGAVYYISSPCKVQLAKKQFSNLTNDYELMFEPDTVVEKAEDQDDVPQVKFNFTPIGDLQSVEKDTTIDTIGVLTELGDVNEITAKNTSKTYNKRELTLVDESGYQARLTIWGNVAKTFEADLESVIAFKGVKVSDFNGRSLSLLSSGSMMLNPDIKEAHELKGWYDISGRGVTYSTHSEAAMGAAGGRENPMKTISQVKEENLGMLGDTPVYFSLKATIVFIKQDSFAYPACITCNKKVVNEEDNGWRCEKCNVLHPKPEYRYVLRLNTTDHTGQIWLGCFDDVGRVVMGMSANELQNLVDTDPAASSNKFLEANNQSWIFKCRAKMDTYNDVTDVKYSAMSATPINFIRESERLMQTLRLYD